METIEAFEKLTVFTETEFDAVFHCLIDVEGLEELREDQRMRLSRYAHAGYLEWANVLVSDFTAAYNALVRLMQEESKERAVTEQFT